jgi:hypothetical protein
LQTNFALDTVKDTQETVAAMKGAAAALKVEHKKINIDAIEVRFWRKALLLFCYLNVIVIARTHKMISQK